MNTLSVIYVGTGEFGGRILTALASDKRVKIPFVITGKDKPSGRHLEIHGSAIKETALKNKLIVHESDRIAELKQKIIQVNPDFLLVCAFGEIVPTEILALPRFGSINVHPSLLPKYRGASPIQEALRNGDGLTGVTWIFMTPKMDAGPILEKKIFPIEPSDNFEILSGKLSKLSALHTVDVLIQFAETGAKIPQDERSATYCKKIRKEDGFIDVMRESALEIINKIRAYAQWPGCSILWNGKRLKIIQAAISEQKISSGRVEVLENGVLALGTGKGALLPARVQLEGKKEMGIGEFLRGQREIPKRISNF